MDRTYWHKQTASKPLFPDVLWSRPQNQRTAGKLLIIGGNSHSFIGPGKAYQAAQAAGVGTVRVLLPQAVQAQAKALQHIEFAAATPSGSFAQTAVSEWLEQAVWADGVLLAGDLGHNSETTLVLEQFLTKYEGLVTLTGDTVDLAQQLPAAVLQRPNTLLVPTIGQLQKLLIAARSTETITASMDFLQLVEHLHTIFSHQQAYLVLAHHTQVLVAVHDTISSTAGVVKEESQLAAAATVWWLQNSTKAFEAICSSLLP